MDLVAEAGNILKGKKPPKKSLVHTSVCFVTFNNQKTIAEERISPEGNNIYYATQLNKNDVFGNLFLVASASAARSSGCAILIRSCALS